MVIEWLLADSPFPVVLPVVSADNVTIHIDGVLYYKVVDSVKVCPPASLSGAT